MMHLPLLITVFLVAGTQFPKLTVGQLEFPPESPECEVVSPVAVPAHEDCPDGYWKVLGTRDKCYKFFDDQCRSWNQAQSKCEAEQANGKLLHAHLAWPGNDPGPDSNALALRDFILTTYGKRFVWLGARGDGQTDFTWRPSGSQLGPPTKLTSASSYWYTQPTSFLSSQCVLLLATPSAKQAKPSKPYYAINCNRAFFTLCEVPAQPSSSGVTTIPRRPTRPVITRPTRPVPAVAPAPVQGPGSFIIGGLAQTGFDFNDYGGHPISKAQQHRHLQFGAQG